jgi:hypothetical protein
VAGTQATLRKEEILKEIEANGTGGRRAVERRSLDVGSESGGLGEHFRGTGGILATRH